MSKWIEELPGLGLGSLSSQKIATEIARAHFYDRLNSIARKELGALWLETMPAYRALVSVGKKQVPKYASDFPYVVLRTEGVDEGTGAEWKRDEIVDILRWTDLQKAAELIPEAARLREQIHDWVVAKNLDTDWFAEQLWRWIVVNASKPNSTELIPMGLFGTFSVHKGQRFFTSSPAGISNMDATPDNMPPRFKVSVPMLRPYNPLGESRDEYLSPIFRELEAYCAAVEGQYRKLGFTKLQQATLWHLDWFVQYQVLNMTCAMIVDRMKTKKSDESTVLKAVKRVAGLLKLPLRKRSRRRSRVV